MYKLWHTCLPSRAGQLQHPVLGAWASEGVSLSWGPTLHMPSLPAGPAQAHSADLTGQLSEEQPCTRTSHCLGWVTGAQGASPRCSAGAGSTHPRWGLMACLLRNSRFPVFPTTPDAHFLHLALVWPVSHGRQVNSKMWHMQILPGNSRSGSNHPNPIRG